MLLGVLPHTVSASYSHTEKSERCLLFALQHLDPIDPAILDSAIVEEAARVRILAKRGRRRGWAEQPVVRAEGPLCRPAFDLGVCFRRRLNTQSGAAYC